MSFSIEQIKRELEGYLMLEPRLVYDLKQAMAEHTKTLDRINKLVEENILKQKAREEA